MLGRDPALAEHLQTYKGWTFVAATALLLFYYSRTQFLSRDKLEGALRSERERLEVLFDNVILKEHAYLS